MHQLNNQWIDVSNPTEEELFSIASKYNLSDDAVKDCLQPDHLPKYEEIDHTRFIVSRIYDVNQSSDADTIQEVSRKISIFITDAHIITVHRSDQPILDVIRNKEIPSNNCNDMHQVVLHILNKVVLSYNEPALKLADEVDFFESKIFLRKKIPNLLKNIYRIKRKVSTIKKILFLSKDIVNKMESERRKDPVFRELLDNFIQQETMYDQLAESTNNLLALYLSITSQRSNEVMRVLTIFSVFFMPLTFIVGIYGMNFKYMPELNWEYGYHASLLLMIGITVLIYQWFKRKGWL